MEDFLGEEVGEEAEEEEEELVVEVEDKPESTSNRMWRFVNLGLLVLIAQVCPNTCSTPSACSMSRCVNND